MYPNCFEELGVQGVEKRLHKMLKIMDEKSARRLREPIEQSKTAMKKVGKNKKRDQDHSKSSKKKGDENKTPKRHVKYGYT